MGSDRHVKSTFVILLSSRGFYKEHTDPNTRIDCSRAPSADPTAAQSLANLFPALPMC